MRRLMVRPHGHTIKPVEPRPQAETFGDCGFSMKTRAVALRRAAVAHHPSGIDEASPAHRRAARNGWFRQRRDPSLRGYRNRGGLDREPGSGFGASELAA